MNINNLYTDLALEVRESIKGKDEEVEGVSLLKEDVYNGEISITTVKILNEQGAKNMNKAVGSYITIEAPNLEDTDIGDVIANFTYLELKKIMEKHNINNVLIAGLGNRQVTPDMLGPVVIDYLNITRHIKREFGEKIYADSKPLTTSAIAPGVMAQTGMEAAEILSAIINQMKPDLLIVVDALAARSINRLNKTIQITDTGIAPGCGVGNNRKVISKETMGIPVIAIGVPTVVDAFTIVNDSITNYLSGLKMTEEEVELFIEGFLNSEEKNMIVTPKNVDEAVHKIGKIISDAVNLYIQKPLS